MTAVSPEVATTHAQRKTGIRWSRVTLHFFLFTMALVWLFPLVYALYTSLRPYADTARLGYVSIGGAYNFDNYTKAFTDGNLTTYFINTLIVVVPAVILTLALASMAAFVLSRFSWRFNLLFLMLFTAGNLLPPQVIITPLFRMFLVLPLPPLLSDNGLWYDQYLGVIAIHVAFQLGFCTFVLSNYMKTLPNEMTEAAIVDGASVFQIYYKVIMPLVRPAFAALVVLETTWIYNDFFWALLLMKSGDRMPITSALNNLKGNFFVDNNLIAAGAIIVALPTMIVFFAAQKQFISGLTLGSTKG
ncbi:MAG: carbohydrate ABC transporter permease [Thermomicrobiales bacterium]|jgi:multiple sugar transport system permease protein|nr:MAG: carbohydrate ABC transporter permease [Thermomicrobiales bacterium]